MKYLYCISFIVFLFPLSSIAQPVNVSGSVINQNNNEGVPFVSIGIKNSSYGTVADSVGNFQLSYDSKLTSQTDSVIFTAVGYNRLALELKSLSTANNQAVLSPDPNMLSAVTISIKSPAIKTYGKSSAMLILAPSLYKAIPKESDEKGREQAMILKVDKDIFLRELVLNAGWFKNVENIKFRMNIYDVKKGIPDARIIEKDVVFDIHPDAIRKIGMLEPRTIDLKEYNIRLQGYKEIAVGIEVLDIDYIHEDSVKTVFFVPSAPNPLKSSFYRLKSQSSWEKLNTSNLMLKLEASVIKKGDIQIEEKDSTDMTAVSLLTKLMGKKAFYGKNLNNGHFVDLGTSKIYYEIYGKGEPLLLLHGNNESIASFSEQIEPLSKHFKVIAVDTRGHGNSTSNYQGDYSYDLFAEDIIQLMDSLDLKNANILGWSDGGNTGLTMAIHHPERVKKLITMGANTFPGEEAIDPAIIKIFEERRDSYLSKSDPYSINQLKLANLVLQQPQISSEQLSEIHLPVLILAGDSDVIKEEHTRYIHQQIPGSQMIILKNADHYAPVKIPKVFNREVIEFLNKDKN